MADEVANNAARAGGSGAQYSVAFETKLASNLYPGGSYRAHFEAANASLSKTMASDGTFANSMSKLGISIPRSSTGNILGKSPSGWVWHHDINKGVMQLVPKIQHPSIPGYFGILCTLVVGEECQFGINKLNNEYC